MPLGHARIRILSAAVASALTVAAFADAPATAPAAQTPQQIVAHLRSNDQAFHGLFGKLSDLADPAKRTANAAAGTPMLKGILADIDALAAANPQAVRSKGEAKVPYEALLVTLGDEGTVADLDRRAGGADAADASRARRAKLLGAWYADGKDEAKQTAAVDAIEKLAKADPADVGLTSLMLQLCQTDATPAAEKRLKDLVGNTMQNPLAARYKAQAEGEAKLKALEGKPLTIAGKLPDGRDFTTAAWKGKVVLVDFWAVWCGPCKAELPRVKKAYADFHDKGLEVLGVSNDYKAETLTKYVEANAMPWPNLFDADAAADQKWNPITTGYGINGIPTMFLIDKNGVCRTVKAREDFETLIPKLLAEANG